MPKWPYSVCSVIGHYTCPCLVHLPVLNHRLACIVDLCYCIVLQRNCLSLGWKLLEDPNSISSEVK